MNLDFIVPLLISALKAAGKQPAVDFLQSFHDKNVKLYRLIIYGLDYGLSEGAIAAVKSKTNIDDEMVAALQEIVAASAAVNGITL
jgi:hypothetical protein